MESFAWFCFFNDFGFYFVFFLSLQDRIELYLFFQIYFYLTSPNQRLVYDICACCYRYSFSLSIIVCHILFNSMNIPQLNIYFSADECFSFAWGFGGFHPHHYQTKAKDFNIH